MIQFFHLHFSDNAYFPDNYLFEFEGMRIQLNPVYGCIQEITPLQQQMLIGFYIFIRRLIPRVLTAPWKHHINGRVGQTQSNC